MGLIEEEDEARLVRIAHFRQLLEQFRQQPEQEGGIEFRAVDQARRVQNVHDAAPVSMGAHHVGQFQRRFAEEEICALTLQNQQIALHGAKRGGGHIAVFLAEFVAYVLVAHMDEQLAQILQVEQQEAIVVGVFESDVQHAFLCIGQIHQA